MQTVIFSMGRIGSGTIRNVLLKNNITPLCAHSQDLCAPDGFIGNGQVTDKKRFDRLQQIINSNEKIRLVTAVREPISRIKSGYFKTIFMQNKTGKNLVKRTTGDLHTIMNNYPYDWCLNWFDNHLLPTFGIDIYDLKVSHDKGYLITEVNGHKILVLRWERMCNWKEAIGAFWNLRVHDLPHINPNPLSTYKRNQKITFPKAFVDKVYTHKYSKHFYMSLV